MSSLVNSSVCGSNNSFDYLTDFGSADFGGLPLHGLGSSIFDSFNWIFNLSVMRSVETEIKNQNL